MHKVSTNHAVETENVLISYLIMQLFQFFLSLLLFLPTYEFTFYQSCSRVCFFFVFFCVSYLYKCSFYAVGQNSTRALSAPYQLRNPIRRLCSEQQHMEHTCTHTHTHFLQQAFALTAAFSPSSRVFIFFFFLFFMHQDIIQLELSAPFTNYVI